MQGMPPPRYKIVERGRRLITVDVSTGAELGLSALLGADPVFSSTSRNSLLADSANVQRTSNMIAATPIKAEATGPWTKKPALPVNPSLPMAGSVATNNAGRWVVAALLSILGLIFVFSLYLWVPIALLLWFPATRPIVVEGFKRGGLALRDWLNAG